MSDAAQIEEAKAARRERRTMRRRAEILDAALRVFERVGYEAASTRLIADEADVSEGTIYNYFSDKGELCVQALRQGSGLGALQTQMSRRDAPLAVVMDDLAEWRRGHLHHHAALLELWAEIMARPRLRQRYEEIIWRPAISAVETALRAHLDGSLAVPPEVAARLVLSSLMGMWLMSLADPILRETLTGPDTAGAVHEILWRGITNPT